MRGEIQHSKFFKSIGIFLIIPLIFITSFSFPRPAHAAILLIIAAVLVVDAVTCDLNVVFYGCGDGAPAAPTCDANEGASCQSAANACNQTTAGTVQCDGSCSVSTAPAVTIPGGNAYGASCVSAGNSCGQTQSNGTWQCNGSCSSTPPANPSGYGNACISAPNACGQTQANGTIQCNGSCSSTPPSNSGCAPLATLSANPSTIDSGQSSTLTWGSSYATSCTAAGSFNTGGTTSGSASIGALSSTQNYQTSCSGPGGSVSSNIATVTVLVPTVSITATPDRVNSGDTSTVSWDATHINSCTITRNGVTWQTLTAGPSHSLSGSAPDTLTTQMTYTMTCANNASVTAVTSTQMVNINPGFEEF
ncbi:MAG: hypothetical protein Q7R59_02770 [bacterium]|nr:hypothetical protein [bacterium]